MRKLLKSEELLLLKCNKYTSEKELLQKAPHKYTLLKSKNLLKILFPVHTCALPPDYVDPIHLKSYKQSMEQLIQDCTGILNKAQIDLQNIQTKQAIDKVIKKAKKALKPLVCPSKYKIEKENK